MAENRQVKIYINGKYIADQIKSITAEKRLMNAELEEMVRGTDEYIKKAAEIRKVNGILDEHRRGLTDTSKAYSLLSSGGITKLAGLAAGAFSADVILSYGKHIFDLGGQMQLLEAKARTVFAEVFPQVTAEAERNAASMGLTNSQYVAAAASLADLLIPMKFSREEASGMSTTLVNLSGALSEWTGGQISATDVSKTLSKAILGEREELKSLGISISEEDVKNRLRQKGLQDLTGEYLQQAKAISTMELILEKSTDAQTAFANNADTMVRRQAELRAELTNISEKLATVLLPVFERLVGIASNVVEGLSSMADGFTALVDPAKGATEAFNDQADKVAKLESELPKLLDRYDELKSKSTLSKTEQAELAKVIQRIGELTPTAITEIDNYGNALSINASKSREFLAAEQKRLKFLNEEAITDTFKQAKKLKELRDKVKAEVESGTIVQTVRTGYGSVQEVVSLKEEDIAKRTKRVNELTEALEGARNQLKFLKGEPLINPSTADAPIVPPPTVSSGGSGSGKKSKVEDVKKGEEEIQKILEKYRLENYLATLDDDEKKIEALRAKYDAEIETIKELEAKKIKGSTAARIELERLKEEELNTLSTELLTARYLKEEEAQKELDAKKAAAIGERVAKELEARAASEEAINEFVLGEYEKSLLELENQYLTLLELAGISEEDKLALLRAYEEKKAALRKEFADKENAEMVTKRKEQLTTLAQTYAAYADIIGGALTALGGILGEQTAAGKVLALAQIAFNTASAITSAVAAGAGLVFPANLPAIATGVTAVLTNFAAARKILNSAPAVPQRYTGGFFDVTGQDDGRAYNAQYIGSPATGLLPNRPVLLASERGQEYLISNPDLQNPRVLNYVRAIENIRQTRNGGGVPQFADGGFSQGPAPANEGMAQLIPLVAQMLAVLSNLDNTLNDGIEATVPDETIVGIASRFRVLNNASGGVL